MMYASNHSPKGLRILSLISKWTAKRLDTQKLAYIIEKEIDSLRHETRLLPRRV